MRLWCAFLKRMLLGVVALCVGAMAVADPTPPVVDSHEDAAVLQQIALLSRDLERLRLFMGAAAIQELDIGIRSAIPRDLHLQALTLQKKANRLLFEVARVHAPPSLPFADNVAMTDILNALQQTGHVLQQVKSELRLADESGATPEPLPLAADPFLAILVLNHQLDALLERHFSPSDVYAEITLAIGYAARLLAQYPDAVRIPEEPMFEPNKQPSDVYGRLMACLQSIIGVFRQLKLPVLVIDMSQTDTARLTPNDVFVVASLIVSHLDFLCKRLGVAEPLARHLYPGLKFPAHSYQRAGLLLGQLRQLECYASDAPKHCSLTLESVRHESAAPQR